MQRFRDNILIMGSNGLIPYSGSSVAVYLAGTSTLASIYPNNDPAGAKENPFRAGDYGEIDFYAQNGRYDLLLTRQGYQSLRITDLQIWDPANSDFVTDVDVDGMIAGKADKTYVDAQLADKADADATALALSEKVNTLDLADDTDPAKGAGQVGYDGITVQGVLDEARPMQSYAAMRNYAGRSLGIRITTPKIAGIFQRDDSDTTSPDNGGVCIVDAIGRRWKREFFGDVWADWFGADNTGLTPSAAAINKALDFIGQQGYGEVRLSSGQYLIENTNPGASTWNDRRGIWIRDDNVVLRGVPGRTVLKLDDGANAHVIQVGSRTPGSVVVALRWGIHGIVVDGNRANQATPTPSDDHYGGIDVASGCSYGRASDLLLKQTAYYGMGMQNGDFVGCVLERIDTEDTGADGIDWKDEGRLNYGNSLRSVNVRRHGLLTTLVTAQAGVDLRGGVTVEDIAVEDYQDNSSAAVGVDGIRIIPATSGFNPKQPSSVSGFTCRAANATRTAGLRLADHMATADNGSTWGCANGMYVSQREPKVTNIALNNGTVGMRFLSGSGSTNADGGTLANITARGNAQAGVILDDADNNTFVNLVSKGNGIGVDVRSTSTGNTFIGGDISGNTTANLQDDGTSTTVIGVAGVRTRNVITSASIPVDVTGVQTVVIPHATAFAPGKSDVSLTLLRGTPVNDYQIGLLSVATVDASNVTCIVDVTTASAMAGATCNIRAEIVVKNKR